MTSATHKHLLAAVSAFALAIAFAPAVQAQPTAALADDPELAAKGVWRANATYVKDDIVTARGSTWIARRNNKGKVPGQTNPPTAADWQLFARGFNPLGAWVSSTTYQPDDLVTHQGQTFRAKRTIAAGGAAPAAGAIWELVAAKGAAGPNTGIGAGSQSMPSISFNGDADTGLYSPGAGKIAMVENGVLFMHNFGNGNTALGFNAIGTGTPGSGNTALGHSALASLTASGSDNTAVGQFALNANTSGDNNTAVGRSALGANTTGEFNTALGYGALLLNTTGNANLAIGTELLSANTTGSFNIAVGSGALGGNTTADNNIGIGINALAANQTGANNVAIGRDALTYTVTSDNTAVGYQALYLNTTGNLNTAIGRSALGANTTGAVNIAIGNEALAGNTAGEANVAVGFAALGQTTTGQGNVAIGMHAGLAAVNPSNSIFIANGGSPGDTNVVRVGNLNHNKAFIGGIRDKTTDQNDAVAVFIDSAGQLGTTSSSRRYKTDIESMADVSAVLGKLRPVIFRYKQTQDNGQHPLQYGLIAEEVADVFPDLAVFNKDGAPETVKYHLLPSFLLAGFQAQQKTIAAQAEAIEAQTEQILREKALNASQADKIDALVARLQRIEALLPQTKAASLQ